MVLVFIILSILLFILLISCLVVLSTLKIKIKNLKRSNYNYFDPNFKIKLSFYLFDKIKWLSINLDRNRIKKMANKAHLENMDIKKIEKDFNLKFKDLKQIKKLDLKISYMDLKIVLGTEDAVLTAFIVFFVSTLISVLLPNIVKKSKNKYCDYIVQPIYVNKNVYKIEFNCIIELKIVHIISIIYFLAKKGRSDKNERASNRRSYEYGYE